MTNKGDQKEDEWRKAMAKLFPFLGSENREVKKFEFPPNVLMEVVSARGLTSINGVDPYCLIRVGSHEVHRTKTIWNDPDPIWTVRTGSLCLLRIPEVDSEMDDESEHSVVVEVNHGNQCIGIVTIPFNDVMTKIGEREEYPIRLKPTSKQTDKATTDDLGSLALRFRKAHKDDIDFFLAEANESENRERELKSSGYNLGSMASRKRVDGKIEFKTQPCADPDRVEETTWLTDEQLQDESLKPSSKWIEAGYGDLGRVFVEIISCGSLANLDMGLNDTTDSFAAIVFEDSLVRTEVIYDCLDPLWMPWSRRAFAFNIMHPSSLLFLGVFDHDELGNHDPIGRVGINTSKFQSNTSYLLHYRLRHNESADDDRGSITIRLRVEWASESDAVMKTFTLPPRFFINVPSEKSLELVRYICRGSVNMAVPSVESVKILAKELVGYGAVICYLIDVIICLWLWRGQTKVSLFRKQFTFWFPIHSAIVFAAAVLAVEFPLKIPAIIFFCLAWALLTLGYHNSTHPDPWRRCKTVGELTIVGILGRRISGPTYIKADVGVSEAKALEKLDKVKADRVAGFLYDFIMVALKIRRIYKKTDIANIEISTEDASWSMFGNNLYYAHLGLYCVVTYLNIFRNFVNWRSYGAYFTSMELLALGTIFLILPMHVAILWTARMFVWITLGPVMKIIDLLFIRAHYRTREELEADPEFHGTDLESILTSSRLEQMIQSGRLASEEAMKLKAMREHKFGKLSQRVPAFDTQRQPSIPLPTSTAQPYLGSGGDPAKGFVDVDAAKIQWTYVVGQHLTGTMVHRHARVAGQKAGCSQEEVKF